MMEAVTEEVRDRLSVLATTLDAITPEVAGRLRAQSYQINLSDPKAVLPGGVYFCGLKPYGAAGKTYPAPTALPKGFTTYRDAPSGSPFYPRARKVIHHALDLTLGTSARLETAFCTNWFFQRAADTAQLKRFGLQAIDMGDIHARLIARFKPRIILCVGNGPISSYAGMLKLFGLETSETKRYLGRSYLRAAIKKGEAVIIGLPHLSRYAVEQSALDFISRCYRTLD